MTNGGGEKDVGLDAVAASCDVVVVVDILSSDNIIVVANDDVERE